MSIQQPLLGRGLLAGDPALTGLLAERPAPIDPENDPSALQPSAQSLAQQEEPAPLVQQQPDLTQPQQAPSAPPSFPGGTPPIAGHPRQNLLGRVHDSLISLFGGGPDGPTGYEGLLTPDEIASTQDHPGLLGLHAAGQSADQIREAKLNHLVSLNQLTTATKAQQTMLAGRQQIYKDIGMPPTSDPDALRDWIGKAIPRLMAIGDYTAVERLSPFADKLFTQKTAATKAGDPYVNTATGETRYFDKTAGASVPAGWEKAKGAGEGTYSIFQGPGGKFTSVANSDPRGIEALAAKGFQPAVNARQQIQISDTDQRANTRLVDNNKKQYDSSVKRLSDQAIAYNKAYTTIDAAAHATDPNERKLLYGSVQSQIAQTADQPNNLRFQLLQYYQSHQFPGIGDRFEIFLDKLTKGELPPKVIESMLTHVRRLATANRDEITMRRGAFLKTHPNLDESDLPDPASYFSAPGMLNDAAAPSAATNTGHLPGNPFAKKP